MKPVVWLPSLSALILILTGCTNHDPTAANDPYGTGPFDKDGNYREDWVSDPSKWTRPGKRVKDTPADEVPYIAKNDQPPASSNPLPPQNNTVPKSTARVESKPRETTRQTTSVPKTTTTRPKPTVAKAKPKPKPKSSRYVVRQGDSLWRIASRNGSSVTAIQKANGISGAMIRPGQSLIIPKR